MSNVTHIAAFRALSAFALDAKINVIGNPWRDGTPGFRFYEQVLAQNPATVGAVIELAGKLEEPFSEKACQGHLRWLFTSAGGLLEVDGQKFAAPEKPAKEAKPEAEKPATPAVKAKPEAKPVKEPKPKAEKKPRAKKAA